MSTYNGELYIKQQLDSIFAQNEVEVSVFARDDNSSDETTNILREYSEQQPLKFYSGNNLGPGLSFIDLIHHCEEYEYYAFADQDDVWESNKLVCAIDALKGYKEKVAFYNSNVAVVDEELTKKSEIYEHLKWLKSKNTKDSDLPKYVILPLKLFIEPLININKVFLFVIP